MTDARAPGRRGILSWCLFDWANSPQPTVVTTFVFSAYFAKAVVGDETEGTVLWSHAMTLSGLAVALLSPIAGAASDRMGRRKPWIAGFALLCIVATVALWWVEPRRDDIMLALVAVGIGLVGFELSTVFYNAMLPGLGSPSQIGRIGGWGWGMGYVGAIACLALSLVVFIQADPPPFGLDPAKGEHVRATALLTSAWFLVFAWPLFAFTPDVPSRGIGLIAATREGLVKLAGTIRRLPQHRDIAVFLAARMIYADGLATLFQFGGLYAAGTFGMSFAEIIMFGIAMNVTAGIGAIASGFIDDRIGGKPTIAISLVGLLVFGAAILVVESVTSFWVIGLAMTLFVGPVQTSSRTLLARMAPPEQMSEMFGLYTMSGRAISFLGPLMLGWATLVFDSQRAGMATILGFWAVGLVLLAFVRAPRSG